MPMVVYTEEELVEEYRRGETEGASRSAAMRDQYMFALRDLVAIIDAAGVDKLMRGVELGPVSWMVKANDRMNAAKSLLGIETPSL